MFLIFFFLVQRVNFESDWKVITLFIGGNDICDHCYNSVSTNVESQFMFFFPEKRHNLKMFSFSFLQLLYSVENYIRNIRDSLDYLHKEVNINRHAATVCDVSLVDCL